VRLYLVRHGIPENSDYSGANGEAADDPGLSDKGRAIVEALAQWMLDKNEVPNAILASPTLRTQETAEILRDAFGLPNVETKGSMGPDSSIRKMVLKITQDPSYTRTMLVSHHETIAHGLRVLNLEPWAHFDQFAEGEMRIVKVKRKSGEWKEHRRIMPSDLGFRDGY
jgi:phosphohistidine phosphatase SixA